jgi:2-desacetyl-2-hydroxyethyl bacteriochlorophyllide A dehydrogenase
MTETVRFGGSMLTYIEFAEPHQAVLKTTDLPRPGRTQAVLETTLSGLSAGTERMWYNGTASGLRSGRRGYPYRPGYELVGRVVDIGDDFGGVQPGDRVFALKPHASHVLLDKTDLWFRLPDTIADEDALAISLAATSIHAVHRADITIGDAVAVAGLGMLGMIIIQVLAATIGGPILALTRTAEKVARALQSGATHACSYETITESLPKLPPIYCAFECSGVPQNVDRLMKVPASQGRIVLAGFYNDSIPIDGEELFAKELTLLGVRATGSETSSNEYNRWDRRRNLDFAFELVRTQKVRLQHLVTHRFVAERFAEAYALIDGGASFQQVCLDWRST